MKERYFEIIFAHIHCLFQLSPKSIPFGYYCYYTRAETTPKSKHERGCNLAHLESPVCN